MLIMSPRTSCIALLAMCVAGQTASARFIAVGDDDFGRLAQKADVVLIGHVLALKETSEETALSDISPEVKVTGIETKFFVDLALKGDLTERVIVLHHYRLRDPSEIHRNGPLLIRFVVNAHRHYLLFLKREADGRFAPAAGQTDAACSIRRILGSHEGLHQIAQEEPPRGERSDRLQRLKESADAPIVLEFAGMETNDGIRQRGKMRVINKTSKDVYACTYEAAFFDEKGELIDTASAGMQAAIGFTIVSAHDVTFTWVRGQNTDNYEASRVQAVVTSVTFTDGSKWEWHAPSSRPSGAREH